MYRSVTLAEPIFLEFPEFKGSSRRDYWLDVTLEILLAHRFVRKYHLKGIQESEAVSRAILGIFRCRAEDVEFDEEATYGSGYIHVGEVDLLEAAVKQSKVDTGKAVAAQETVNQVKVDGIDANIAIMKELLFPLIVLARRVQFLASWEEPFKSSVFLVLMCYLFLSGWFKFVLPFILVFLAVLMLWHRLANKGKLVDAFRIIAPPNKNAVEQLITLQEAISQVETLVQAVNIVLLKMRALLLAVLPEATYRVSIFLLLTAALFILVPFRIIILFVLMEPYTREMPLRRESSYRWLRRLREWWFGIPAAPVQLIKHEDSKKNK